MSARSRGRSRGRRRPARPRRRRTRARPGASGSRRRPGAGLSVALRPVTATVSGGAGRSRRLPAGMASPARGPAGGTRGRRAPGRRRAPPRRPARRPADSSRTSSPRFSPSRITPAGLVEAVGLPRCAGRRRTRSRSPPGPSVAASCPCESPRCSETTRRRQRSSGDRLRHRVARCDLRRGHLRRSRQGAVPPGAPRSTRGPARPTVSAPVGQAPTQARQREQV